MTEPALPASKGNRLGLALVTLAAWVAITFFGAKLLLPGERSLDEIVTTGIAWQIVLAALLLVAVIRWQGWADLGFRAPKPGTLRLLSLPGLIIALFLGLTVLLGTPGTAVVLLVLANTLVVGFSEETMFRGILYRALRTRMTIWPAILLTTAMFGGVHVINGFITGDFGSAAIQAVLAGCSGLMLMAVFLRTGSLWAAIVVHGLWDFATFVLGLANGASPNVAGPGPTEMAADGSASAYLAPLLVILPNLVYGLWLLRSVGRVPPPGDRPPG